MDDPQLILAGLQVQNFRAPCGLGAELGRDIALRQIQRLAQANDNGRIKSFGAGQEL